MKSFSIWLPAMLSMYLVATAANVADATVLPDLLHGDETRVWGDQAYRGQREVIRNAAPNARRRPPGSVRGSGDRDPSLASRLVPDRPGPARAEGKVSHGEHGGRRRARRREEW